MKKRRAKIQEGFDDRKKGGVLRHHINLLRGQDKYLDYINYLSQKIVPLIKRLYPSLYGQWMRKWRAYPQKKKIFELEVLDLVRKAVEDLVIKLRERNLFETPSIAASIDSINAIYAGEHGVVIPPPYMEATSKFQGLCSVIAALGHEDLILDYAFIKYEKKIYTNPTELRRHQCRCRYVYDPAVELDDNGQPILFDSLAEDWSCPKCGLQGYFVPLWQPECIDKETRIISFKEFAPSLRKLWKMESVFFEKQKKIWIAWEFLSLIERSLQLSRHFFRRKKTGAKDNKKNRERIAQGHQPVMSGDDIRRVTDLLELRLRYEQLALIGPNDKVGGFYSREEIDKNLNIILHRVGMPNDTSKIISPYALKLETGVDICSEEPVDIGKEEMPKLRLLVEWVPGVIEALHLHTFRNIKSGKGRSEDNMTEDFIDELVNNPGIRAEGSTNAGKILNRVGIHGALEKLFVKEKKGNGATLFDNYILLADKSETLLKNLAKQLEKLDSIGWK